MVTEIATIEVAAGGEDAFEQAMRGGGVSALAACEGVRSVQFGRGVESPSKFAFVVVWDSVEAHERARASESFKRFRAAFGSHGIGGTMAHFDLR
jgi:heme-degrading monooxygenase HmoA